jgi:hypothetical protein
LRAIVEDPSIGMLVNAGPNNLHAEPSVQALAAGKHVFREKPLAESADKALAMWKAGNGSQQVHQAAFIYRFVPAVRHLRDLVRGGEIGEITHFRSNYLMNSYLQKDLPFSCGSTRTSLALERSGIWALTTLMPRASSLAKLSRWGRLPVSQYQKSEDERSRSTTASFRS